MSRSHHSSLWRWARSMVSPTHNQPVTTVDTLLGALPDDTEAANQPDDPTRWELMQRFEAWLDEVLADEPAPCGIDEQILADLSGSNGHKAADQPTNANKQHCDRLELWSAMTTLCQEVKLQGRAFKQLDATMMPLSDCAAMLSQLDDSQTQVRESFDALAGEVRTSLQAQRQVAIDAMDHQLLDVLLDLHGQLSRGITSCANHLEQLPAHVSRPRLRPRWWRRLFNRDVQSSHPRQAIESLKEGSALGLDRINDMLGQLNVRPIDAISKPFDPDTMVAVNVVACDHHHQGTVLEVYEPGFTRRGEPLRLVKVKVAAAASSPEVQPNLIAPQQTVEDQP